MLNKFRKNDQFLDERSTFLSGIGVPEKVEFVADQFQLSAIESAVNGLDTLVVAPTGSGKTFIAEQAIRVAVEQGKRAIYTTPLKALTNSKYNEFKIKFPNYTTGILTGDRKIDGNAQILVATTEIYRNELYNLRETYSLVVLDEIHYIADEQRGAVWEESIILSPKSSTLLMLSASISNPGEIADWIKSVRNNDVTIIKKEGRPVELRWGFLHPENGVLPLSKNSGEIFQAVDSFYKAGGINQYQSRSRDGKSRDGKKNFRSGRGRR